MIDSRECLSIEDSGVILVRASGSTWITYKCIAMKRILSKYIYSAYTKHVASLSVDPSFKPADRAKLKGYYQKWPDAK